MAIPKNGEFWCGKWIGEMTLILSWLPEDQREHTCPSSLQIVSDPQGTYLTAEYDWERSGPQNGKFVVVTNKAGAEEVGWVDSWHQSSEVMHLTGTAGQWLGSYSAGEGLRWGWRIVISVHDDTLSLKMFNIPPGGDDDPAVIAEYQRAR